MLLLAVAVAVFSANSQIIARRKLSGIKPGSGESRLPSYHPTSAELQPAINLPNNFIQSSKERLISDAKLVLSKTIGIEASNLRVSRSYKDNAGILHVYVDRLINGIPVLNQGAEIRVKDNRVVKYSTQ